jgi:hypothetical protein
MRLYKNVANLLVGDDLIAQYVALVAVLESNAPARDTPSRFHRFTR